MTILKRKLLVLGILAAIVVAGVLIARIYLDPSERIVTLGLVVPDDVDPANPVLTAWLDAAAEEGLPLRTVSASQLLRPRPWGGPVEYAGLILPDTVHRAASDTLLTHLEQYVQRGGQLMVVYDAATLTLPGGAYARRKSRLSGLVGVDYALYDALGDHTLRSGEIHAAQHEMLSIGIPPGKFIAAANAAADTAATGSKDDTASLLSAYKYEPLAYGFFVTRGKYPGKMLLASAQGDLVAGYRRFGTGQVFFLNLAAGYLKTRTDGLLLHSFLNYFGAELAGLPVVSPAPNGIGGLVMNWHVDSNAALPALRRLKATGIFEQGPYSVHFTAGPDTRAFNDGLGLNIPANPEAQEWVRFFAQRGDEVGSHGGWIHDYFGTHVSDKNSAEFEAFLQLNKDVLEKMTGRAVTEYSAPVGTHPLWVTEWMRGKDIHSYYSTGNSGMGPTRSYRNDRRSYQDVWAFPVSIFGGNASFEEMLLDRVPETDVASWLRDITDFAASQGVVRLIYFHPPGLMFFPNAVDAWLERAQAHRAQGAFSWYTMADIARFMSRRDQVQWQLVRARDGGLTLRATHSDSLARVTWRIPARRFARPEILEGKAEIIDRQPEWLVQTREGARLAFRLPPQTH
ncbi:MAG: polysaccharide deacetylase family protein [Betaproteobacteria bacterium]|nr:polysaccharide deacetylase family protein [Betaproteobacteria bacterium]